MSNVFPRPTDPNKYSDGTGEVGLEGEVGEGGEEDGGEDDKVGVVWVVGELEKRNDDDSTVNLATFFPVF